MNFFTLGFFFMKTLLLWEMNTAFIPLDPKERIGLWLKMLESVKIAIDAGITETWGYPRLAIKASLYQIRVNRSF